MSFLNKLKEGFQEASLPKKAAIVGTGLVGAVIFHPLLIGAVVGGAAGAGIGAAGVAVHDAVKKNDGPKQ